MRPTMTETATRIIANPLGAVFLSCLLAFCTSCGASSSSSGSRRSAFSRNTVSPRALLDLQASSEDADALSTYLTLAQERHDQAVDDARAAYWNADRDTEITSISEIDHIRLDTVPLMPPSSWSLPDFADELSHSIKVTAGADDESNDSKDDDQHDVSTHKTFGIATPLFTPDECNEVIRAAESHFGDKPWTTLPSGQYDVAGFWINSVPAVHEWFNRMLQHRLFPLLQREFPRFCTSISELCVDNAYVFKYTPETGRRTDVHTDSGCLSFTISLGGDYQGGGTWIEGGGTIRMGQGHVTVRPGGVRHCGQAVTSGTRYIIGGFCMHKQKVEHTRMLIVRGAELAKEGDLIKAKECFEAAILINPRFDGTYSHLANVCQQLNQPEKARQILEYCHHNVNPNNGEIAYTLGMYLYKEGELDQASACLDACIRIDDSDVDAMLVKAQICAKQDQIEDEIHWYYRIIHTPGAKTAVVASAYNNLAAHKEGTEEEIELYEKALEVAPHHFPVRYSLGCALGAQQKWSAAVSALRLAVDLAPSPDLRLKTLKTLYHVALEQVKIHSKQGFASRELMIAALQEVMGKNNFDQLAAASASASAAKR